MKKRTAFVTLTLKVHGVRRRIKVGGIVTVPLSRGNRTDVTSLLEYAEHLARAEAERPGGAAAEVRRLREMAAGYGATR